MQSALPAPALGPAAALGLRQPSSLPPLPPLPLLPQQILEAAGAPSAEMPVPASAVASPPSMAPPLVVTTPPSLYADELACFAMKCHLADECPSEGKTDDAWGPLGKTDITWEPLRCNELTGRVEVPYSADSPVEPTLGRMGRQVSYPTQVVRRAISFVFDDGPNSPVNVRRNTAMAA